MPYVEKQLGSGLNLKASATDIAENQLREAAACRFDVAGAVSSDRGRVKLNSTALAGEVRGHGDVYRGTTKHRITKALTTVYEDFVSIDAVNFTSSDPVSVVSYNDIAYIGDGTTLKAWDGTTMRTMGIAAPSAAPSTGVSGSGNLIQTGTYKYVYTFYNGVAESNFSPIASQNVTLGEQVDLTNIAAGPTGTTARRIYRTDLNGTSFFFLAEIADNTTTIYTDTAKLPDSAQSDATPGDDITDLRDTDPNNTIYDHAHRRWVPAPGHTLEKEATQRIQVVVTNLGYLADWLDHDPPDVTLKHLTFLQEQLFGIVGNTVRFSKVGQPEHWPLYNQFTPGRQSGETLLAIKPLGRDMIVYTDSAVYRFALVGLSFEDSRLEQIDSPVGLAAEWGVADVLINGREAHLFIARKGLYIFDGQSVVEVSFPIEPLFTDSSHADYINPSFLSSVRMASHRDRVWMSYGKAAANDRLLRIDYQSTDDPKFSVSSRGLTTITRETKDNTLIGGDSSGDVFELDTGASDDGTSIAWTVKTKSFPLTGPQRWKKLEAITLDADLGGVATTLTVESDLGRSQTFTLTDSGRKRIKRNLLATMGGYSFSAKLTSTGAADRHLYAVGWGYQEGAQP